MPTTTRTFGRPDAEVLKSEIILRADGMHGYQKSTIKKKKTHVSIVTAQLGSVLAISDPVNSYIEYRTVRRDRLNGLNLLA